MLVGVKGKIKEIKENGILVETGEEEIFISNSYNGYIFDFNKLELRRGDPIVTHGTMIFDCDSDSILMFEPSYIMNATSRKYIPPLCK